MAEEENKILIAGTYNSDLEGGRRTKWVLESFKPDIIVGDTNQLLNSKASTKEMIWAILFDEYEISIDVQEKWKAIQTYKEHLAAYNYATAKRIPYFMIDNDEKLNSRDVSLYAQTELIEELKVCFTPDKIQNHIRRMVEQKFNHHQKNQHGEPYCKKYYQDRFLCKESSLYYADERGENLAREFQSITRKHQDVRIFGFFKGTQVVRPDSIWATQILGRPVHNLRYHLGKKGIEYGQLVDLI